MGGRAEPESKNVPSVPSQRQSQSAQRRARGRFREVTKGHRPPTIPSHMTPHLVTSSRQQEATQEAHLRQEDPTLRLHGSLGVLHGLPGAGDVQEDGVRHPGHPEAVFAHVLVPDGDQVVHAVLPELLRRRLRPLLVELHRVQVTRGGDGAQDGVREGAAARSCAPREGGR